MAVYRDSCLYCSGIGNCKVCADRRSQDQAKERSHADPVLSREELEAIRKLWQHAVSELSGWYGGLYMTPASVSLLDLKLPKVFDAVERLQGRWATIEEYREAASRGEPIVVVPGEALAEHETREANERLKAVASEWAQLAANWQHSAYELRNARDEVQAAFDELTEALAAEQADRAGAWQETLRQTIRANNAEGERDALQRELKTERENIAHAAAIVAGESSWNECVAMRRERDGWAAEYRQMRGERDEWRKAHQALGEAYDTDIERLRARICELETERDRLAEEAKRSLTNHLQECRDRERMRAQVSELETRLNAAEQDAAKLSALEAAGVDNWPGYEIAMEQMEDEGE